MHALIHQLHRPRHLSSTPFFLAMRPYILSSGLDVLCAKGYLFSWSWPCAPDLYVHWPETVLDSSAAYVAPPMVCISTHRFSSHSRIERVAIFRYRRTKLAHIHGCRPPASVDEQRTLDLPAQIKYHIQRLGLVLARAVVHPVKAWLVFCATPPVSRFGVVMRGVACCRWGLGLGLG